jgi:hypothetical protein
MELWVPGGPGPGGGMGAEHPSFRMLKDGTPSLGTAAYRGM